MEDVIQQVRQIQGNYQFRSPYHKSKKMLPFNVSGYSYDAERPVQVETVEYKGYTKYNISSSYKLKDVLDMIDSGFLTRSV